ncbi:hypothetical protein R6Q59_004295 [Mikania micrantha]
MGQSTGGQANNGKSPPPTNRFMLISSTMRPKPLKSFKKKKKKKQRGELAKGDWGNAELSGQWGIDQQRRDSCSHVGRRLDDWSDWTKGMAISDLREGDEQPNQESGDEGSIEL